jgi:rhodanese-related sulfurtransferase
MESTCYLLADESGFLHGIITGDTLFIGDVGRPDLAQHVSADLTPYKLASHLYDSLREKIMTLPDHLIIYPNHGAGSACGKHMSSETTDTLGHQKEVNYALRADMTREEFIRELMEGQNTPPSYFPKNVLLNKGGYESFDKVLARSLNAITAEDLIKLATDTDFLILDTREADSFAKSHIPGSIQIGIDGNFAPWVGNMIPDIDQKIIIVAEPGRESEVITRLSRIGYDSVAGYLDGGMKSWSEAGYPVESIKRVDAVEFAGLYKNGITVVDVRRKSEYELSHIKEAVNISLESFNEKMEELRSLPPFVIHCAGGYRSMIAASILKSRGVHQFFELKGGYDAVLNATTIPVVASSHQYTLHE